MMLEHLIIQFPLYYLSSDRLRQKKQTKENFKFLLNSSKSGRGRLRELIAYKRFQV